MPIPVAPMEDELGDVLDKAMRHAGLTEEDVAERAGIAPSRIADAVDYRSDLTSGELRKLADILSLNEVGLCALGCGTYPLPELPCAPFRIDALRMQHGIGVANAYVISEPQSGSGILFDTGPGLDALLTTWPAHVRALEGVFLTHVEGEHAGGLCDVVERFAARAAFCPAGAKAPCTEPVREGERMEFSMCSVRVFSTPGHASAHNCYLVESRRLPGATPILISGDLFFAGSVGGAHFCHRQLLQNVRRVLADLPPQTIVCPGHGPMTTVENERRYNPFVV